MKYAKYVHMYSHFLEIKPNQFHTLRGKLLDSALHSSGDASRMFGWKKRPFFPDWAQLERISMAIFSRKFWQFAVEYGDIVDLSMNSMVIFAKCWFTREYT